MTEENIYMIVVEEQHIKSNVSTSLTHRRRPWQSTMFSSNMVTDTAAIFSRLKGRHRQDAHGALLILKLRLIFELTPPLKHARGRH